MGENTLLDGLLKLREQIKEPVSIQPTQLIISERTIYTYMKKWKLSRVKTIERIKRSAAV